MREDVTDAIELANKIVRDNRRPEEIESALKVADSLKDDDISENEKIDTSLELNKTMYVDKKALRSEKRRKSRLIKYITIISLLIIALVCGSFLTFAIMKIKGKKAMMEANHNPSLSGDDITYQEDVVYRDGRRYVYNEKLINILVMGIDDKNDSDANLLLCIDPENNLVRCININRDSISQVRIYDTSGNYISTSQVQIALSYSYGKDGKDSCVKMRETVSNMFYELPIHGYISVNMKSIPKLNDAVGGVELKALETLNENITKGQMLTLKGQDALKYVTDRDSHSGKIGTNSARLKRQKQYLSAWYKKFKTETSLKPGKIVDLYDSLKDDLTTDLDGNKIAYLSDVISKCSFDDEIIEVPGKYERSNYYDEYIIDTDGFVDMILEMFYTEV